MKTGLGIDTGGTYTDAVIYDFSLEKVLFFAKSPTTKNNLSTGIINALSLLPVDALKKVDLVSLSTTLATNACVEGKGGRAKLILIDADKSVVEKTGQGYGLPPAGEIYFLDGKVNIRGEEIQSPDWEKLLEDSRSWAGQVDAMAVVQYLGVYNPVYEKETKALFEKHHGLETVCGHHLFTDLNYIKRGASCLLNARLIPLISDFLKHIRTSLDTFGIKAPVVIVRSDGSLMSESVTTERPVETLLCGPAASVTGGVHLTKEKNCIVVDMGGTTTDLALVKDGYPVRTDAGVNIGKWKTFVKSVYIETFGLGGDSHIRMDNKGSFVLGPARALPICHAALQFPGIKEVLRDDRPSLFPKNEFYCLAQGIHDTDGYYSRQEREICMVLRDTALNLDDLAKTMGISPFNLDIRRLEEHGIVLKSTLTPTDIMHARGDFDRFDQEASLLAASAMAGALLLKPDAFCGLVYEKVKETLYTGIIRMILQKEHADIGKKGTGSRLVSLIQDSYMKRDRIMDMVFQTRYSLVGIGAPIHLFLPDVAKALGTKCIIPKDAPVANALGAIVGNIMVKKEVRILPEYSATGITGYIVFLTEGNRYVKTYEEALEIAQDIVRVDSKAQARHMGAVGEIIVKTQIVTSTGTFTKDMEKGSVLLETLVSATALGKPVL
ncbi:MAG: hydantoinase/oxoprolinase family protein [Clostridia bacterium]